MTDLVVVAASVLRITGTAVKVTFGATIEQGESVYQDPADGKWKLADADVSAILAGSTDFGIAMDAGANNQEGLVLKDGSWDPGVAVVTGQVYVISATAGGVAPIEDLITDDWVTILGYGNTAGRIVTLRAATGEQHP